MIHSPSPLVTDFLVFLNDQHTQKMGMDRMSALGLALVLLSVPDN